MAKLNLYAEAFSYPGPGRLEVYRAGLDRLPESPGRTEFAAFLQALGLLTLGEWEELHTRTLDLNPEFAPYVGYQMWGDSYKRGGLMSRLNRAMRSAQVDLGGELPDHLMPVLRYLDRANERNIGDARYVSFDELAELRKAIGKIRPDSVQLNTLDRPGAEPRRREGVRRRCGSACGLP